MGFHCDNLKITVLVELQILSINITFRQIGLQKIISLKRRENELKPKASTRICLKGLAPLTFLLIRCDIDISLTIQYLNYLSNNTAHLTKFCK